MSDYSRKLYEVTVSLTYYAYTYTPDAAVDYAEDAVRDAYLRDVAVAREVPHRDYRFSEGWNDDSPVYCHDFDKTLGDVRATLPLKGDGK